MGKLIYSAITSLDGFMADLSEPERDPEATVPNAAEFSAILELQRPAGTYLYGRRMYETMAVWETAHVDNHSPAFTPGLLELERDFASVWRAANKVVFSTTLSSPTTPRTRIERAVDVDEIRSLKSHDGDVTVGGPHLAATMIAEKLVDDFHVFVHPVILGRGIPWLPEDVRVPLELVRERRLDNVIHLHYRSR